MSIHRIDDFCKQVATSYFNIYVLHSLEEAREIANKAYSDIHEKCDKFVEEHKNDPVDHSVDELLDDVAYQIMKSSVQQDLLDEKGCDYSD